MYFGYWDSWYGYTLHILYPVGKSGADNTSLETKCASKMETLATTELYLRFL